MLVRRIPSILLRSDYQRIFQYIRLFGITAFYREAAQLLNSENAYFFDGDDDIKPVKWNAAKHLSKANTLLDNATVSVVIPTKNAGEDFRRLLSAIQDQRGLKQVEIIVVDSGSTDKTVEFAKEFEARVIQIKPESFTHSFARNLGAEYARGDYILFTVQDAVPPSTTWLRHLFDVLQANNVAAVSCGEMPGPEADFFHRVAVWQFDKFMQIIEQDRILRWPKEENYFSLRMNSNLSDIACLISKDIFAAYRFQGNYAEDVDLGLRLIKDGHQLAFLGSNRVIHSHNRSAYYHLKRAYIDTQFFSQTFPDYIEPVAQIDLLVQEILFTYNFVDTVLCRDIQRISIPCSMGWLARSVTKAFNSAAGLHMPTTMCVLDNRYIDRNFKSFLDKLRDQSSYSSRRISPTESVLFEKVRTYTMMAIEYLDNNYDSFRYDLREEFIVFLFKLCAHMFGTVLAFSMIRGSSHSLEMLERIHDELSGDV